MIIPIKTLFSLVDYLITDGSLSIEKLIIKPKTKGVPFSSENFLFHFF